MKECDLQDMREKKLIGYRYYSNWEARQLHKQDFYFLTVKGIKEFYKEMFRRETA